jgi:2-hydroxychromene-2-carboxylate isomerase
VTKAFAVSFDYRCPFARNAHESVVAGLRAGRDWDVTFTPFSLDQVHVEDGGTPVWDRPEMERGTGVRALEWGLAVRDRFSEKFLDWHMATFAARHEQGAQIAKEAVLRDIAASVGLDPDAIKADVDTGKPLQSLADEHSEASKRLGMWGVPTFVDGEKAVFIRFMDRGIPEDIDRALDLLTFEGLNEFKHTRVPR